MKKLKHSKFKNTGLLFEILVRQLTSDTLNDVKESHAGKLIKKYRSAKQAGSDVGAHKDTIRRACRLSKPYKGNLWVYGKKIDINGK